MSYVQSTSEEELRARIRELTRELADAKAEGSYAQVAIEAMAELRERTEKAERLALAVPQYLTSAQVGDYLGVTIQTLCQMRKDGSGPPFSRITSRCIRYERGAVDRWMRRKEREE